MSLLRLLAQGKATDAGHGITQIEWRIKKARQAGDGVVQAPAFPIDDADASVVRMNLRMVSGVSPLRLADLKTLSLPEKIVLREKQK